MRGRGTPPGLGIVGTQGCGQDLGEGERKGLRLLSWAPESSGVSAAVGPSPAGQPPGVWPSPTASILSGTMGTLGLPPGPGAPWGPVAPSSAPPLQFCAPAPGVPEAAWGPPG